MSTQTVEVRRIPVADRSQETQSSVKGNHALRTFRLIETYPTCDAEGRPENSFRVLDDSSQTLRFRPCPGKACRYSPNPSILIKSEKAEISLKGGN